MQIGFAGTFRVNNPQGVHIIQQITGEKGTLKSEGQTHTVPDYFDAQIKQALTESNISFDYWA